VSVDLVVGQRTEWEDKRTLNGYRVDVVRHDGGCGFVDTSNLFGCWCTWVFVLARERRLRIRKILKTAAVVSRRVRQEEHTRRGGKERMVVVGGRDAEKKKDALSQPTDRSSWGQIDGWRVLGNA